MLREFEESESGETNSSGIGDFLKAFFNVALPFGTIGSWLNKRGDKQNGEDLTQPVYSYSAAGAAIGTLGAGLLLAAKFYPDFADVTHNILDALDDWAVIVIAVVLMLLCRAIGAYLGQQKVIDALDQKNEQSVSDLVRQGKTDQEIDQMMDNDPDIIRRTKINANQLSNAALIGLFGSSAKYVQEKFGCKAATAEKEAPAPVAENNASAPTA